MDIKEKINEIVEKLKSDPSLMEKFQKDPIKTVEDLAGIDLPDDQLKPVVEGIKAKISLDKLGGVADALGGLFGKK